MSGTINKATQLSLAFDKYFARIKQQAEFNEHFNQWLSRPENQEAVRYYENFEVWKDSAAGREALLKSECEGAGDLMLNDPDEGLSNEQAFDRTVGQT